MNTSIMGFFKKISWQHWTLVVILLLGIFLRTYHFHDFLRFNADQSRDATVVSDFVTGKSTLPLLGPKAGGTEFRVGPVFYYFQIAAAALFGNAPDVVAYPDLLTSLLFLPLLYCFLRKYFDRQTALLLLVLGAVSAYAVKYSRFAWNPNSLPFWSLLYLYALHETMLLKDSASKWWPIIAGVALGVGVQLHTLTLILFPLMTLGVFGFLLFMKKPLWKRAAILVLIALVLNTGQIVSEIQTGGANTKAFFSGIGTKEQKGSGLLRNVGKDVTCFVEGTTYILSAYDASDSCETKGILLSRNAVFFWPGLLFFLGGLLLAGRSFRREQGTSRQYFLGLVLFYFSIYFALLVPLANEVSMRFFLGITFLPFVLLGLWYDFLRERCPKRGWILVALFVLSLMVLNLVSVRKTFTLYTAYLASSSAGMDNVLLPEVERSAAFVVAQADGASVVAVHGDAAFLFKALKSMQYFTGRSGIKLIQNKGEKSDGNMPVFLIDNTKGIQKILASHPAITEYQSFGRFTIFKER